MSEIELSPWQNPEDGFPTDEYFDAVDEALKAAGIGIHESFRSEGWEYGITLDRAAFADGPLAGAHDVFVGWRVDEESDPLGQGDEHDWHGWHGTGGLAPGWFWMRCKPSGEGMNPAELPHPQSSISPMDPLEEPDVVAAAVVALTQPAEEINNV